MRRGVIIKESLKIFAIHRFYVTTFHVIVKGAGNLYNYFKFKAVPQSGIVFLQGKEILSKRFCQRV